MSFYQGLVNEINALRRNPSAFADKLLSYKSYFKDTVVKFPGQKVGMQTQEGFAAYEEAANYLKTLQPIGDMGASKGLSRIAKDYLVELTKVGPEGAETIDMEAIIKKYGNYYGIWNNAMDFGSETPELVVISFVVSDGDESRANRDLLLNPELKRVGIASGPHQEFGTITVVVSCGEFKNVVDQDDNEDYGGVVVVEQTSPQPSAPATTTQVVDSNNESDLVSSDRRERIVIEHGRKKRKIIWLKKYKNGKKKKEVKYELL
jgi:hypothetical protein